MKTFIATVILLILAAQLRAVIDIPDDYPTIQQGINAAVNGDTVLIASGIYIEALEIHQLDLTLASHFLTTGDTTFISSTVIDGDSTLQLLDCIGPESIRLIGLTFRRGLAIDLGGNSWKSGGINTQDEVDLQISACLFREFSGTRSSVMLLSSRNLSLDRCQFEENQAEDYRLINMWLMDTVSLRHVVFQNNYNCPGLFSAAGVNELTIDSCLFNENDCTIWEEGALVSSTGSRLKVSNSQFSNNSGLNNYSLVSFANSDTSWIENCIINSNTLYESSGHALLRLTGHHYLFVNSIQITNNSCFDSDDLAPGINAYATQRLVADSIFIQNNFADYDEQGSDLRVCYLSGYAESYQDTSYVSNVFIEDNEFRRTDLDSPYAGPSRGKLGFSTQFNMIVDNLVVANNQNDVTYQGLGVHIYNYYNRMTELRSVVIHDNNWTTLMDGSNYGSAIYNLGNPHRKVVLDNVTVYNQYNEESCVAWLSADSIIVRDSEFYNCGHGALGMVGENLCMQNTLIHHCYDLNYHEFFHPLSKVFRASVIDKLEVINCTVANCEVYHGPVVYVEREGNEEPIPSIVIQNSFVENLDSDWPAIDDNGSWMNLYVKYSNVIGGYPGEGNIDNEPLFTDPSNHDYTLQPESPCIDAGHPLEAFNDPEDPDSPGFALWPAMGTLRNDMGVYGGSGEYPPFEVVRVPGQVPREVQLHQNYPNPFNPTTTIEFTLPHPQNVELAVYNILGEQVALLAKGIVEAGVHQVTFDGSGLASGVYVYRMTSDSQTVTRKMMIIK